ncbi:hypothetical protein [Acetanaerobacterium elongatum]|uniref:Uncharacterized protein n=1 Tax=Acetanaerobacterium elongatum TaxID=258515 RepID=A0A1H0FPP4_9FIRM|nr:hypothetical protein [Acetanaerobacterium elongatum]SDN96607.1 hypothetical protein SAMN05192585_14210 [Acetanaerobacterium elongatum]
MTQKEFKRKWDNYWYYYKWHTIAGVFVLFLAILFTKDMIFKEKFDATILLCTSYYVDDTKVEELEKQAEKYFPDVDKNGEVNIAVEPIFITKDAKGEPTDPQTAYAMQMKMIAEITSDPAMVYIFDQSYYDTYTEQAPLRKLSDDFPGNKQVENSAWKIGESDFAKNNFLKDYFATSGQQIYASMGNGEDIKKANEQERYKKIFEGFANMVNNKAIVQ